jgi:hypothetical protein
VRAFLRARRARLTDATRSHPTDGGAEDRPAAT